MVSESRLTKKNLKCSIRISDGYIPHATQSQKDAWGWLCMPDSRALVQLQPPKNRPLELHRRFMFARGSWGSYGCPDDIRKQSLETQSQDPGVR